jgi:uncharacterized membrane protein
MGKGRLKAFSDGVITITITIPITITITVLELNSCFGLGIVAFVDRVVGK